MRKYLIAAVIAAFGWSPAPTALAQDIDIIVGADKVAPAVPPIFQFGGGVWRVPKVMPWVAQDMLDLPGRGGTYRAALAWEVLAESRDLADIEHRLKAYALNDFLKQVAARGGDVIISLDGMPKWLAADKSEKKMADGPAWAKSTPASGEGWRDVVEVVVRHFNGALGIDAIYEVWNEPDWSLRGSVGQYLDLYRWSVIGAKRGAADARMAGPALSDWSSPGVAGTDFFFQSFFNYAARTKAPEVGLNHLPIDAVTWHSFYRDHTVSYALAAQQVRTWLQASGYPGKPLLIVDEWNIASAEPPYPEGDINGGYAGAVHVAAALIAMNDAGIDRQTFQMMVDPGSQGYSGGAFTPAGVARPSFNAFRKLAEMRGSQLSVQSSQKWVRVAAFADTKQVHVLIAVAPPSDNMLVRGIFESLPVDDSNLYQELKRVPKEALASFVLKNANLPRNLSPALTEMLQRGRDRFLADRQARETWKNGVSLHIALDPSLGIKSNVQHSVIDRSHAGDAALVDRQSNELGGILRSGFERAQQDLNAATLQPEAKKRYMQAIEDGIDRRAVIANADPTSQAILQKADRALAADFEMQRANLDRATLGNLAADTVALQGSAFDLKSEAVALHYLVFDR